ncbi:hypothetical protein R84B8_01864 [Treponema sp. R8-4-B8]
MPKIICISMKKLAKTKKIVKKTYKRRKKNGFSEHIQAFLLVGALVAVSALISCAVIAIHSSLNKENVTLQENESRQPEAVEMTEQTIPEKPESQSVEVSPPDTEKKEIVLTSTPTKKQVTPKTRAVKKTPDVKHTPDVRQTQPVQNNVPVATTVSAVINPKVPVENKGTLVFIIDDAGNNLKELEPFLRIQFPFTIAVLPGLPHSAEAARRIRESGKEVILHQPMEAIGGQNPGPGAIYSGMSAEEIRSVLSHNIDEIGPVAGMNNHQGSKITMDKEAMRVILAFCDERGICFIDSRTTADTVVPIVANQMGIRIAERNVFIDNEQNRGAMLRYISTGLARAQKSGSAVMIGHTWSPDLAPLLADQFPDFIEQGYTLKTASDIIKR